MRDGKRKEQEECLQLQQGMPSSGKAKQGSSSDCQAGRRETREEEGRGRARWHSLVVSASKNEKLHVASGAAIVVSNCLGYFTLTIDRNDAQ